MSITNGEITIRKLHDAVIRTEFVHPPIPLRQFDWSAVDDNTYDGEGCPVGRGATEQEAIDDLLHHICKDRGADTDINGHCRYCTADQGVKCRAKGTEVRNDRT